MNSAALLLGDCSSAQPEPEITGPSLQVWGLVGQRVDGMMGSGRAQACAAAERLVRWALALARLMHMEVDSRSPWRAKLGSWADLLAAVLAIFFSSAKASVDQAPVVSATMGIKTRPTASHSASVLACSRLVCE